MKPINTIFGISNDDWIDKFKTFKFDSLSFSPEMKKSKKLMVLFLKYYPKEFSIIDKSLKNDIDFIISAINVNSEVYYYINPDFHHNQDIVLAAIYKNINIIKHINDNLKTDFDFHIKVLQKHKISSCYYFDEKIINDKNFIIKLIDNDINIDTFFPKIFFNDFDVAKKYLAKKGEFFKFFVDFHDNEELATIAIKNAPIAYKYVSPRLKDNVEIFKLTILNDHTMFRHRSPNISNNKELVKNIIYKDVSMFRHVGYDLLQDSKFVNSFIDDNFTNINALENIDRTHFIRALIKNKEYNDFFENYVRENNKNNNKLLKIIQTEDDSKDVLEILLQLQMKKELTSLIPNTTNKSKKVKF